jgi:hypothetical protein
VPLDHQQEVMFLTFFVYRTDGSPYWVTATLQKVGVAGLATFPQTFTGDVYETHGPYFGMPFDPTAVTNRKVGTATFTATTPSAATLQYSIDGTNVTKNIERQTLRLINFTGIFLGGTVTTFLNCINPANNNQTSSDAGLLTIIHSGTSFRILAQGQSTTCTFNGTYSQRGRLGYVTGGTYSCGDGTVGTFTMGTLEWTVFGMSGNVAGQNQFCQFNGYFGGITNGHVPNNLLKLRSDQTDSVSVDLHQRRLDADGVPFSFDHNCGRLRRRSPEK